jgi:hypothetical protein
MNMQFIAERIVMLRVVMWAAVLLLVILVTGCTAAPTKNADLWREAARNQQLALEAKAKADADRFATISAPASTCDSDLCRVSVAAFAALAAQSGSGAPAASVPAPPYERDGASKLKDILIGASPLIGSLAGHAVSWRQSDNNVRMRESDNEAQQALYAGAFGLGTAAVENAGARTTVGGDLISGHVGDTLTGDGNATRGGHVGDTVGGDQVGRDDIDGSIIGDGNRIESPGPFEDVGNCEAGNGAASGNAGQTGDSGNAGDGGDCNGG